MIAAPSQTYGHAKFPVPASARPSPKVSHRRPATGTRPASGRSDSGWSVSLSNSLASQSKGVHLQTALTSFGAIYCRGRINPIASELGSFVPLSGLSQ